MRSESKNRAMKYTSAREMVDKRAQGFTAPYLKLPEGVQLFKPKAGVMLLDILPFVAGENNPWAEEGMMHWERTFYVHRGIGANSDSYLCPRKTHKQPCPICEYCAKLEKEGDEGTDDLRKSLIPKERQLFNVINRKEPDKGVQLWDFSFHLFGKLLQARIRDSDEEDGWDLFFTLDKGLTVKVGFAEQSYAGRSYFEAETIDFKPRSEPYDESILDEVHPLDELLVEADYDTLKKTFLTSSEDEPAPRKAAKGKPTPADDEEDEEEAPKKKAPFARGMGPTAEDEEDEPAPKKRGVSEEPRGRRAAPEPEEDPVDELSSFEVGDAVTGENDEGDDVEGVVTKVIDDDDVIVKDKKGNRHTCAVKDLELADAKPEPEEEEEPAPKKKSKPAAEEEDEEPAPKKKAPASDDWDDFDAPPAKSKKKEPEPEEEEEPAPKKKVRR